MTGRVLVLNASFEPINVCTERRAVVMIFKGVARVEEHNGHMLHSAKLAIHAPSVIRLTEYMHIPFERRSLSRKNILLRDHSTCQYCGRQYPPSELTLDHVLPRSRGGESSWDNLVACCKTLQSSKGKPHSRRVRHALAAAAAGLFASRESPNHALSGSRRRNVEEISLLRIQQRWMTANGRRSLSRKEVVMNQTILAIGGLGTPEIIVIAIVIFLLFGATRLPQLAKSLGQSKRAFKEGLDEGEKENLKEAQEK